MSWLRKTKFLTPLTLLFIMNACTHYPKTDVISPEVESYLMEVDSWKDFSPLKNPSQSEEDIFANECTGTFENDMCKEEIEMDNAQYSCTTKKYTITDTPEKIVMYSPDVEILWPGALIQGKSHKEPGSLLGLIVRDRTPIKVSIPALTNPEDQNFREVKHPDQAEVMKAIGEMVGKATIRQIKAPSTIHFEMRKYHSEQEFALSTGISGKYLGFRASASTDIERKASETTIAVHLYQKMYEVVVEPPSTPYQFFSTEFTMEKLQEQINLGKVHKTKNIPIYVSNVVYGRMMMFTLTSEASEADIKAALNASYSGLMARSKARLSFKQEQLLNEAKISITSLGGDAAATQAMIRTGNWSEYFKEDAPLSSAAPLSYTFRNLRDGSIAKVSESTTYYMRECSLKSKDFILASFENGTENWKVPGAKGTGQGEPELVEWLKSAFSIKGNFIRAQDSDGECYYFKAPIDGFLEFINKDYYGGTLSYWQSTQSRNGPKGKYQPYNRYYGDHIELVGANGITLTYIIDSFPMPENYTRRYEEVKGLFTKWHKFSIPLSSRGKYCWKKKDGNCADVTDIKGVLAEVISLKIRGEYWFGGVIDYTAIDEVKIAKPQSNE